RCVPEHVTKQALREAKPGLPAVRDDRRGAPGVEPRVEDGGPQTLDVDVLVSCELLARGREGRAVVRELGDERAVEIEWGRPLHGSNLCRWGLKRRSQRADDEAVMRRQVRTQRSCLEAAEDRKNSPAKECARLGPSIEHQGRRRRASTRSAPPSS